MSASLSVLMFLIWLPYAAFAGGPPSACLLDGIVKNIQVHEEYLTFEFSGIVYFTPAWRHLNREEVKNPPEPPWTSGSLLWGIKRIEIRVDNWDKGRQAGRHRPIRAFHEEARLLSDIEKKSLKVKTYLGDPTLTFGDHGTLEVASGRWILTLKN